MKTHEHIIETLNNMRRNSLVSIIRMTMLTRAVKDGNKRFIDVDLETLAEEIMEALTRAGMK